MANLSRRERWCMALLALWLLLAFGAPYDSPHHLPSALFAMAPPVLLALPVWGVGAWWVRRFRKQYWALPALLFLIPWFWFGFTWNLPTADVFGGSSQPIRILSLNVHRDRRDFPALVEMVRSEKIEVVVLQEVRGGPQSPARYLQSKLPGWHLVDDGAEGAILSVYPLSRVQIDPQRSSPGLMFFSVEVAARKPFRVLTGHWERPHFRAGFRHGVEGQIHDCGQVIEHVANSDLPILVAGDFNLTPRSPLYSRLLRHLRNSHDDAGLGPGWNYFSMFPLMRIDQIFGSDVQFVSARVGPNIGSDHRPVLAGFVFSDEER